MFSDYVFDEGELFSSDQKQNAVNYGKNFLKILSIVLIFG
jgi:hypothetical protein